MHGNIVTLCGMSSFVMLSEGCLFKEKSEKKKQLSGKAWLHKELIPRCIYGALSIVRLAECCIRKQNPAVKLVYTYCRVHSRLIQYTSHFYTRTFFTEPVKIWIFHWIGTKFHTLVNISPLNMPDSNQQTQMQPYLLGGGNRGLIQSFPTWQHSTSVYHLRYILNVSWSPSWSVVDAVMPSSAASASGSTCTQ